MATVCVALTIDDVENLLMCLLTICLLGLRETEEDCELRCIWGMMRTEEFTLDGWPQRKDS